MKRALIILSILALSAGVAAAQDQQYEVEIEAAAVGAALEAFADQTGLQVAYLAETVSGKRSGGFTGSGTAGEILDALLDGTGLKWKFENDRTVTVSPSATEAGPNVDEQGRFHGELVVTANLREESAVDVASSLTAYDDAFLEERNVNDIRQLVALTPSAAATTANPGTDSSIFVIRNIDSGFGNTAVGVYVDDVSTSVNDGVLNPSLRLFDMERVEILRGPQGTLYGAGAMGGAVKYVSKKPNMSTVEGQGRLEAGSVSGGEPEAALDVAVSVPLVREKLALRLVGSYVDGGGYIDLPNATAGPSDDGPYEDANSRTNTSLRGTLRWQPSDRLNIDLVGSLDDRVYNHYNITYALAESAWVDDIQTVDPSHGESRFEQLSLNVAYQFGWAELRSITGVFRSQTENLNYGAPFPPFMPDISSVTQDQWADTISQEFRLASTTGGRLSWIAGLYFQDMQSELGLVSGAVDAAVPTLTLVSKLDRQQVSVFGEVDYRFSEKWTGTLGFRYYEEDAQKWRSQSFFGGPPTIVEGETPFDTTTPRAVLAYRPSDRLNLYGSISTGFRVGGINNVQIEGVPTTYDPDFLTAYEVGMKTLGSRFGLTAALYYNGWKDIQTVFYDPLINRTYVSNGEGAHSTGLELQLDWQATRGLRLGLAGNVGRAQYDQGFETPAVTVEPGDRLPNSPDWSVSFLAGYDTPLTNKTALTIRVDGAYTGDRVHFSQVVWQGDSSYWNALVGIVWESWELSAFVRNISNDVIFPGNQEVTPFTIYLHQNNPRTIGVRLLARF